MKRLTMLLIITGLTSAASYRYGFTHGETIHEITRNNEGHEIMVIEEELRDAEKLKSWNYDMGPVPTFKDPEDARRWGNRYDPESTARPKIIVLPYEDTTICVKYEGKLTSCFELYDLTER